MFAFIGNRTSRLASEGARFYRHRSIAGKAQLGPVRPAESLRRSGRTFAGGRSDAASIRSSRFRVARRPFVPSRESHIMRESRRHAAIALGARSRRRSMRHCTPWSLAWLSGGAASINAVTAFARADSKAAGSSAASLRQYSKSKPLRHFEFTFGQPASCSMPHLTGIAAARNQQAKAEFPNSLPDH